MSWIGRRPAPGFRFGDTVRNSALIGILGALAFIAAVPASATDQVRDTIVFAGKRDTIIERPLSDFLRRLPEIPRFDIPNTANYKGYEASWEVRGSRLYLASFSAATNRQPYSISMLFPRRKLPIHADWYSGTVHIIGGREALAQGYYTYERVTGLRITNGVVTATNEMRNVREDKLKK